MLEGALDAGILARREVDVPQFRAVDCSMPHALVVVRGPRQSLVKLPEQPTHLTLLLPKLLRQIVDGTLLLLKLLRLIVDGTLLLVDGALLLLNLLAVLVLFLAHLPPPRGAFADDIGVVAARRAGAG